MIRKKVGLCLLVIKKGSLKENQEEPGNVKQTLTSCLRHCTMCKKEKELGHKIAPFCF